VLRSSDNCSVVKSNLFPYLFIRIFRDLLQVPLIQHPQRQMLLFQRHTSFTFQSPWYMSSQPGSPAWPLRREMPVSIAFPYITFKVPSKGNLPLHVPLTQLHTERNTPFPEPSIIRLSKSLVNDLTPGCLTGPL